jgi:CDP-diacylglycerol---glycerol-3-phosphate 3-phosphatidyltransferase
MYIAHYFTFLRILIIPFFPLVYLEYEKLGISSYWMPYLLLFILIICALSDLVDGFIARKRNEVSDLGKVLDPMADSITNIIIFFTFTQGWASVPLLLVFVFIYREFLISTLRTICALKGFALAARRSGKIKTIMQFGVNFLIILAMIAYTKDFLSLEALRRWSFSAVGLAATYSLLSAIDYLYANRVYLKKVFIS